MSSYYDPAHPPTPPTRSATIRQIVAMLLFGGLGSTFVIRAIRYWPEQALYTGTVLIVFAFMFAIGMISKSRTVELISCGVLAFGLGLLGLIYVRERDWLWLFGFVFFAMCIVVILLKPRYIDASARDADAPLRNPYA